jgi:hypothetical protein
MKLKMTILAMLLVACGSMALAQRAASSKISGSAYHMWSSGVYFDNAVDHSRLLQNYASYNEPVPQQVVTTHAEAIKSSLAAAKKSYSGLVEKHPDDKTVAAHLKAIDEHHAAAGESLDKLHATAASGDADPQAVKQHSAATLKSLRAAKMEHGKLMQHLGIEDPMAKGKGKGKGKGKAKQDAAN